MTSVYSYGGDGSTNVTIGSVHSYTPNRHQMRPDRQAYPHPDDRDLYTGPTVEVNYGDLRTSTGWLPESGQDAPLIIFSCGQWDVVNIRQLAYLYDMARYSGEPDYLPEAVYYTQGTVPVLGRVTDEQVTPWDMDGDGHATFRITVTDGNPDPRVIASGTYRVNGDV